MVPLEEKAAGAGGAAGGQLEAFNARIEQLDVVGLVALAGCPVPTIALLYEDNGARHVTTYAISTSKKVRHGYKDGWMAQGGPAGQQGSSSCRATPTSAQHMLTAACLLLTPCL